MMFLLLSSTAVDRPDSVESQVATNSPDPAVVELKPATKAPVESSFPMHFPRVSEPVPEVPTLPKREPNSPTTTIPPSVVGVKLLITDDVPKLDPITTVAGVANDADRRE
jgi:hypothetical protein